ncbi:MAG: apolipoprotein N-acyltransferase [Candidatus Lambdaproteobacteria bacterium RIFOXYD2_FULL_50_16]|uniref:Apolipoprotein N-acyltransferase n=1 Tax=Candidatus Lambdaproteobacteria bacterium RIFOXYD2_FULL_50_16 TaxID=1817772 RepID=A0A1F6G937_9PROT|nr:MAG: apolipoprotein N-acyltransferase [Candidatus Lambdaproteobacteria bacterium RIFOXYD2_FULL_50_16]
MDPRGKAAYGLAALAGAILASSFPGPGLFPLTWIALLPLILALDGASPARAWRLGVVFGTVGLWGGFYWIGNWAELVLGIPAPFGQAVAGAYALVNAQCFGLILYIFQKSHKKLAWADPFLLALIWVLVFSFWPWLFPFKLADSQAPNLPLIQPLDLVGPWGLDLMILLVNGGLYMLLRKGQLKGHAIPLVLASVCFSVWIGYGLSTWGLWQRRIQKMPLKQLGIVQPNRPAQLGRPQPEPGYSRVFPLEMRLSKNLVDAGAEVLLWPEGYFFGYAYWRDVEVGFGQQVAMFGVPLLFLDSGFENIGGKRLHYNTTFLLSVGGSLAGKYHKRRLVPFGEYTPVLGDIPLLKNLLGEFLSSLSAGQKDETLNAAGIGFVPKICYEVLFEEEVAQAIGLEGAGKVLFVQSQDGWYGRSIQPEQHLAASVLRAVENRVPLVHVINNGPSSVINADGSYGFKADFFRQGAWLASLAYDPQWGGSLYSAHPSWFLWSLRGVAVVLLLTGLIPTPKPPAQKPLKQGAKAVPAPEKPVAGRINKPKGRRR